MGSLGLEGGRGIGPSSPLQERLSPQPQGEREKGMQRRAVEATPQPRAWRRPRWAGLCVLRGKTSHTGRWVPTCWAVVPWSSLLLSGVLAGK